MKRFIQVFALVLACAGSAASAAKTQLPWPPSIKPGPGVIFSGEATLDLTAPIEEGQSGVRYFSLDGYRVTNSWPGEEAWSMENHHLASLSFQSVGNGMFEYTLKDLMKYELGWTNATKKKYTDLTVTYADGSSNRGKPFSTWSSSNSGGLSTGAYDITWTGAALIGGSFDVLAQASPPVPAVPEPSTWAMLLAGLLFIGHVVRRRMPTALSF